MNSYATFRRFPDRLEAEAFGAQLAAANVRYEIENNSPKVDVTFVGNPLQRQYIVKVYQEDWNAAKQLLEAEAAEMMTQIDSEYYLFDFTNEELFDLLKKPDEWNELDQLLAPKILKERGEAIDNAYVDHLEAARLSELKQQKEASPLLIKAGYALALATGIFGVMIGWILMTSQRTLPDSSRQALFGEKTTTNGRWIFLLGVVCFLAYAVIIWSNTFGR